MVATNTGTTELSEFLTTTAKGISDDSGRTVAAAKLHANKTSRLRAPSAQCSLHSLPLQVATYAAGRRAGRLDVWECRIFQLPSAALIKTRVSRPRESKSRSPILALMKYSDVAYAD